MKQTSSDARQQNEFLRTMLKNTRYTGVQADGSHLAHGGQQVGGAIMGTGVPADKENQKRRSRGNNSQSHKATSKQGGVAGAPVYHHHHQGGHHHGGQDPRFHQAGPSVTTRLHALGHLPQYDGAAESLSSAAGKGVERTYQLTNGVIGESAKHVQPAPAVRNTQPVFQQPSRRLGAPEGMQHFRAVDRFFTTIRDDEQEEISRYNARYPLW